MRFKKVKKLFYWNNFRSDKELELRGGDTADLYSNSADDNESVINEGTPCKLFVFLTYYLLMVILYYLI